MNRVVGCLSNPVALRSRIDDDPTFLDFLLRTHRHFEDARQHQSYPLPHMLAQLNLAREPRRSPLVQVTFSMPGGLTQEQQDLAPFLVGTAGHRARIGALTLEALDFSLDYAPVDLLLRIADVGGSLLGGWQFDAALFEPLSIAAMHGRFTELLRDLIQRTLMPLSAVVPCRTTEPEPAGMERADNRHGSILKTHRPDASLSTNGEARWSSDRGMDASGPRYVARRCGTEHYVARVWEELLGVRSVGVHDDFFALGGHSLKLATLCARLRQMFGVEVPFPLVMERPTIDALAEWIDRHGGADAQPVLDPTEVEFEADAQLDPAITLPADTDASVQQVQRVLLTGATGFLGAFLLDELLRQTSADAYCLVRASSSRHRLQRIRQNLERYGLPWEDHADRVIPILGDLAQPRQGLSQEKFDQLASRIEVIYHNGAILNFAFPYKVLRDSNVHGTQEVIRLAMQQRLKPMHDVSTVAVHASSERNAWDLVGEEDPLPAFASLKDGYSQTKWMSEKLIAEARRRGLPVSIYRPGGITGHSLTGNSNTGDMIHEMVLGCFHLGTIPQLDVELNLAPVDFVAGSLVELSRRDECLGGTYHLVNPESMRLETLVSWVQEARLPLDRMPVEHWRQQVTAHIEALPSDVFGLLTKSFMPGVISGQAHEAIPAVLQLRYDCRNTLHGLRDSHLECPRIDAELLTLYFAHLARSGLVLTSDRNKESR